MTNQSRTFTGRNPGRTSMTRDRSSNLIGPYRFTFLSQEVLPTIPIEIYGDEIQCTNITLKNNATVQHATR